MTGRPPYGTLPLAQQENNGFRPLLRPRGKTATIASVVIAVIGGTMLFENVCFHSKRIKLSTLFTWQVSFRKVYFFSFLQDF